MAFTFTASPVAALSAAMQEDIQVALYAYLSANLPYPIYDNVPQDTGFPYYAIGVPVITALEADKKTGLNMLIPLHAWSEYHGRTEVIAMQKNLYASLHRANLEITGYNCISILQENETILLDPDGVTRHGIQQFRILIINK